MRSTVCCFTFKVYLGNYRNDNHGNKQVNVEMGRKINSFQIMLVNICRKCYNAKNGINNASDLRIDRMNV